MTLACVMQRQGPLSLSQQKRLFHARQYHKQMVVFCFVHFLFAATQKTTLTMMKMEDAKLEVSASNNSNSESSDSGLLQDRFTDLCKSGCTCSWYTASIGLQFTI